MTTPKPTHNVLLLQDIPPSILCGIDLITFTTTLNFQGFKQIPTGYHFIYTSPTSSDSIRHGIWFASRPSHNLPPQRPQGEIKKWDSQQEHLVQVVHSPIQNNPSILESVWDKLLIPYRQQQHPDGSDTQVPKEATEWYRLTDCISSNLLDRILGSRTGSAIGKRKQWELTSVSSATKDIDAIPGLDEETVRRYIHGGTRVHKQEGDEDQEDELRPLQFLEIDLQKTWPEGAVGRERTEAAQDRSWALGELLKTYSSSSSSHPNLHLQPQQDRKEKTDQLEESEIHILGELQFTFLMTLTLSNYSCMKQWKRILQLIFTCRKAVLARPVFFTRVLKLLKSQLKHSEEDVEGGLFDLRGEGGDDIAYRGGGGSAGDEGGGGAGLLKWLLKSFRRGLDDLVSSSDEEEISTDDAEGGMQEMKNDDDGDEGRRRKAIKMVKNAYDDLENFVKSEFNWEMNDSYVRKGLLQLEDGEEVEMEVDDLQEEDERGEYAPVVVDLGDPS
ncbi:MAG: ribosomal protein S14, S11 [Watsoniomyces obsoletus]|nr:MAG: ribosomal protein S14, S11 [Watsoniomyces obsoletus]